MTRAQLKREAKKFVAGGVVTPKGLFVDITDDPGSNLVRYARIVAGRRHYFVAFDGNMKCFQGGHGPITKVE